VLPPENATGNWVKVVQRVPVRLQLTRFDAEFPLQAGLSADVTVDTRTSAPKLADANQPDSAGTVSH
jgi:membrane fusion protein (multidrug efflux system)